MNMTSENRIDFVHVVGYGLERIHGGVLSWIFDTDRSPLERHEILQVLNELNPDKALPPKEPDGIKAHQEFGWGRRKKIDLVLKFFKDGQKKPYHHILYELKTDSEIWWKQLEKFEEEAKGKEIHPKDPPVGLIALGASQVTAAHQLRRLREGNRFYIGLQELLKAFSPIQNHPAILDIWLSSLYREKDRLDYIEENVRNINGINGTLLNHELVNKHGYRSPRVLFFYYYDALRQQLGDDGTDWAIYDAPSNPVMNFRSCWFPLDRAKDPQMFLFMELNWDQVKVKGKIKEHSDEHQWEKWQDLRQNVILPTLVDVDEHKMTRGQNRRGKHVTVAKALFDKENDITAIPFQEMDIKDAARFVKEMADDFKRAFEKKGYTPYWD